MAIELSFCFLLSQTELGDGSPWTFDANMALFRSRLYGEDPHDLLRWRTPPI